MKIIANIARDGLIVEMTRVELAKICGLDVEYWRNVDQYTPTRDAVHPNPKPGTEFKVSKMYEHVVKLSNVVRELATAKKTLEAVTSLLELPACFTEITEAIDKDRASR